VKYALACGHSVSLHPGQLDKFEYLIAALKKRGIYVTIDLFMSRKPAAGEFPQSIIPAWTWQSTVLTDRSEDSWGLFGAVCTPGFEYEDFMKGSTGELIAKYPEAKNRILELGL